MLFRTSVYFAISKLTLEFSYSFQVQCTILFNVYFHAVLLMSPFLFNQSLSKASVANQLIHPRFAKNSTIGQLKIHDATAENEN